MERGLVTRGVNVRPHKRSTGSSSPAGLRISSVYDPTGSPGRPLVGYRAQDFGLRTGRRSTPRTLVRSNKIELTVEQVRQDWEAAVQDVEARRAQGIEWRTRAQQARGLKATLDRLEGKNWKAQDIEQVHSIGAVGSAMGLAA